MTFVPATGFKINKEYPWKMEIVAPEGLGLLSNKLKKDNLDIVSDDEARFKVAFKPSAPGDMDTTSITQRLEALKSAAGDRA